MAVVLGVFWVLVWGERVGWMSWFRGFFVLEGLLYASCLFPNLYPFTYS